MPLVFVHGVATRDDDKYPQTVQLREKYFRQFALPGVVSEPDSALIENPYWGKYGIDFAWNHASLPEGDYEQFGAASQARGTTRCSSWTWRAAKP